MAIINPDLRVDPLRFAYRRWTAIRAQIDAPLDKVRACFGDANNVDATEWSVRTPVGDARLTSAPEQTDAWQIEASTDHVLPWIFQVLTGSTVGFVSASALAGTYFETLAWGYARFAFLRGRVETRPLAQQLTNVALELRVRLLAYGWMRANQGERDAWVAMPEPSKPSAYPWSDFVDQGRWRARPQDGEEPDRVHLPQDLAVLVAEYRAARADVARQGYWDMGLYDDITETLHALATNPIPGADTVAGRN